MKQFKVLDIILEFEKVLTVKHDITINKLNHCGI